MRRFAVLGLLAVLLAAGAVEDRTLELTDWELVGVGAGVAFVAAFPEPTMIVPFIVGCTAQRKA